MRRSRAAVAFVAMAVLFGGLVAVLDGRQAWALLQRADWRMLPAALACTVLSYLCIGAGYASIQRIFGVRLPRFELTEIGFVSAALNNLVSTGGLAGYSLRLLLLSRRGIPAGEVLGASLVHSYFNHIAMMSLLPAGLLYLLAHHPLGRTRTGELAVAAGLAVAILALTTWLLVRSQTRSAAARAVSRLVRVVLRRDVAALLGRLDDSIGRGVLAVRTHPAVLGLPLVLVLFDWIASVAALGFCFAAFGPAIHLGVLLTGFALGVSAGFLSMLPGGMGAQEASMTGVFVLLGVDLEQAVLAALLFRIVYYVVPFVVSLALYAHLVRRAPEVVEEVQS